MVFSLIIGNMLLFYGSQWHLFASSFPLSLHRFNLILFLNPSLFLNCFQVLIWLNLLWDLCKSLSLSYPRKMFILSIQLTCHWWWVYQNWVPLISLLVQLLDAEFTAYCVFSCISFYTNCRALNFYVVYVCGRCVQWQSSLLFYRMHWNLKRFTSYQLSCPTDILYVSYFILSTCICTSGVI